MPAHMTADARAASVAPVRKQVYEAIRRAIVDLEIRPGDRLVERELIDMTGASRTSVREALRELESDGLVSVNAHRRLMVAVPTESEVGEIYEVRGTMLGLMVRHFTESATDAEVNELLAAYTACLRAETSRDFQVAKEQVYGVLAIHARIANGVLSSLAARIAFFRHLCAQEPGRQQEWNRELGRVIDAVVARDVDLAVAQCAEHVESAVRVVLRVLERYPWFLREP